MPFFALSRPTIRHYTYSLFSLYALYVQTQKKRAECESVRLKLIFLLTAKSSSAAYIHQL